MNQLPTFHPERFSEGRCEGRFSPSKLIGQNWLACLISPQSTFTWGRFVQVDSDAQTAVFAVDHPEELEALRQHELYRYLDFYWGKRAELVLANPRQWRRTAFAPSDSVEFREPGS